MSEDDHLKRWLEQRDNKHAPFKNAAHKQEVKLRLKASIFEHVEPQNSASPNRSRVYLKIAASIAILLMTSVALYSSFVNRNSSLEKVILSDGSIIWLKENATIDYPEEFTGPTRQISFTGEALFEIAKDPNHPFVIKSGDVTTTVLGTSFNLKATNHNVELLVLTGKVSVTSVNDKKGILVLPNEKAVYKAADKLIAKEVTPAEEHTAAVKGTEYNMAFNNTRMEDFIERVENKFNVQISISDRNINNCLITADFTDRSLERTLDAAAEILGFEYTIEDNTITVTGAGCQLEP